MLAPRIDQQDNDGNNALVHCIMLGDSNLCKLLLDKGIDIDKCNKRGETVLMHAAVGCTSDYIFFLLSRKATLSKQDESGRTALDHAEGALNSEVVQLFRETLKAQSLEGGADN